MMTDAMAELDGIAELIATAVEPLTPGCPY